MKEIVTFLLENWQVVLAAFLAFISFIMALLRKRPNAWSLSDYIRLIIAQFLPGYICDAEATGWTGERKREHVLAKCMKALKGFVRCTDKEADSAYEQFKNAIELILNTPQKKV